MKHLYRSSLLLVVLILFLANAGAAQDTQPVCGDGVINSAETSLEECDGSVLGEATCTSLGFSGGALSCNESCQFETQACEGGPSVYVVSTQKDKVSVINTATNTITAKIRVGKRPRGIAISPDGALVYVTNFKSGTVSVVSTATNTVIGKIKVGKKPQGVAFTPDGTKAYVVNSGSNTVSVIHVAFQFGTPILVGADLNGLNGPNEIPVGQEPQAIAITPDGLHAYVTNFADGTVSILNLTSDTVEGDPIQVGDGPDGVAVSPDGMKVVVVNFNSRNASVIDTSTNTVTKTIEVGLLPVKATFSPDGATLFITNFQDETVSVIKMADFSQTFYDVGDNPDGIVVTAAGKRAYVALFGRGGRGRVVGVFSTTTGVDIAFIRVERGPFAIAVTPSNE